MVVLATETKQRYTKVVSLCRAHQVAKMYIFNSFVTDHFDPQTIVIDLVVKVAREINIKFGKSLLNNKPMKSLILILLFNFFALTTFSQTKATKAAEPDKNKKTLTLETACGQCQFGLTGESCDLAVRMDGKAYFVVGTDIDSHGDAHSKHGFCNAVRMAKVQGELKGDRFKVTYFQLLPEATKGKKLDKQKTN